MGPDLEMVHDGYVGGCQNYGTLLGPSYNTAPRF